MISSPCAKCSKRDLSKDQCIKSCELLQAIQGHQASVKKDNVAPAVDYADEGRFVISSLPVGAGA